MTLAKADTEAGTNRGARASITSVVLVGFGAISRALMPILLSKMAPGVTFVAIDPLGSAEDIGQEYGPRITYLKTRITPTNLHEVLKPLLGPQTFLLNLTTGASSLALIALCQETGALYLDTGIEPWSGGYTDPVTHDRVTNYALRKAVLDARSSGAGRRTAVIAHGANPGLISHFAKAALLEMAGKACMLDAVPEGREAWARLARDLGVKVMQVAERDMQQTGDNVPPRTFLNTWSVIGLLEEMNQPAEFGLGTHETALPDAVLAQGDDGIAAHFTARGADVRVKSWMPEGPYVGMMITHNESISLADYLTCRAPGEPVYRPTVYYAYRPCDATMTSIDTWRNRSCQDPERTHVLKPEGIVSGADYLGILIMSDSGKGIWYGSILNIEDAVSIVPFNTATTLQVAAGVYGGMMWAIGHPCEGIVEAEDMQHEEVLAVAKPYLGIVQGFDTDWGPQADEEHSAPPTAAAKRSLQLREFLV
ncbi:saccharopine dehydrogenase NADP-binding domain-containing protein [Robbsia sp. Bb-Pol-6]|uniref:Saccharopine dehydrogenase NADP-binding domain-containing protein n=1 Tax=Robbsia betulipollinis TaxID=2981849 RepID=A0ABT3ZLI0_9BURK|nr:saccharopine dehydrogenase C-terminal domain-containing protein [Robbsia betulipollinis]MCY0387398.1 saccharopine dehydrogenase NADP-binding domain-containing protein [Robbsia betulipollinis]